MTKRPFASNGRFVIANGRFVIANGRFVIASGRFVIASGRFVIANGRFVTLRNGLFNEVGRFSAVRELPVAAIDARMARLRGFDAVLAATGTPALASAGRGARTTRETMANKTVHLPVLGFGQTLRKDAWWVGPALTVTILLSFIVYATFRAFENRFYGANVDAADFALPYLTPFASPYISTKSFHLPMLTPAMLILAGPASFRFTCYYYRKAYYRSFAMDPPACAVGERNANKYNGETKLFVIQNFHRYAMYVAVIFLLFLWKDAFEGFLGWKGGGVHAGLGSFVMLTNCLLLSAYTFGCHSFRHLIGGSVNSFSTAPLGKLRHSLWKLCTKLNERHQLWAWCSLFGVALTDVYIRSVASGAITDVRFF